MHQSKALFRHDLPECADSVEAHPFIDGLFALATYQVDQHEVDAELKNDDTVETGESRDAESPSASSPPYSRKGLVRIYQADVDEHGLLSSSVVSESAMPAVLDTKWTLANVGPQGSSFLRGLLGVADAAGHVTIHGLQKDKALRPLADFTFNPHKALCLSLDWSDRRSQYPPSTASTRMGTEDASLIVSQSDGKLAWLPSIAAAMANDPSRLPRQAPDTVGSDDDASGLVDASSSSSDDESDPQAVQQTWENKPIGLETWHAHDHEAWIAAFDAFSDGKICWSGGDDLALKGWDTRTPVRRGRRDPTFTNRRGFDGGVTTLQSHWSRQHQWAVGSYDGILRLFDARMQLRPTSTLTMPGGIWRLKWHPSDPSLLLAGCMHGGFTVVDVEEAGATAEIISTFEGHGSLAYGCDWERGAEGAVLGGLRQEGSGNRAGGSVVYSCSFYDKLLCGWVG
ncbi:unnamed protein product [Parajaminaea phylloscopi]